MKKNRDSIAIYHDHSENSEDDATTTVAASPASSSSRTEVENSTPTTTTTDDALKHTELSDQTPIKLTSMGAVQLTPSANATTNAILSLKNNPFFHDKRKWDDSFTVAEKKELLGNIVKAAKDNDGETYVTLQEEEFAVSQLSHEDEESQESDDLDGGSKKPGRKPMADEEALSDSDQDPKVKRKAQNRAAQRAFRERKERYVKELEAKIKQVQDTHLVATAQLVRENHQLRSIIYRLEAENYALKGIPMQPYQHQTSLPPQSQSPQPQQQHRQNGSSNYPSIAPLLPHQNNQQPLLLPAYLSNSPNASPALSLIHSNSSSVNHMMMLAQSPLQQYPMSPVVSAAMSNGNLNSSPSPTLSNNNHKMPMPISKKVSAAKKNTPPPNNQPLEYTFSISTPASLRPSGGSVSSSKHTRSEPVELVQLYPPSGSRNQHQQQQQNNINSNDNNNTTNTTNTANSNNNTSQSPNNTNATLQKSDLILLSRSNNYTTKKAHSVTSISSSQGSVAPKVSTPSRHIADDESSIISDRTTSTVNTQQQRRKMQQLESDMYDCHIDTEGQIFCEKLHSEVCNDAFDRLLSEPLFDQMGKLNLSISSYPVPIVTGHHMSLNIEDEKNDGQSDGEEQEEANKENRSNTSPVVISKAIKRKITKTVNSEERQLSSSPSTNNENKRLLTCPEIWFLLNQHENFANFTTDQLCQAVKELAKCADSGPVLEEDDLFQIMSNMDRGFL